MWRLQKLLAPPTSLYERNARNVMVDGIGVGLVSGIATFLSVFLVRLGASNVQVGLLTAMPALVGALCAIPLGQFLGRQRNLVAWYARSRLWVLSSYALIGIMPFFVARSAIPNLVVLIWALATLPQVILNVTFTMVMSAVAGPTQRIALMSRRWTVLGIATALSVAAAGWTLDRIATPLNYQVIFIASFGGGLLSFVFSTSLRLPPNVPPPAATAPWYRTWGRMLVLLRTHRRFTQFVASQFLFRAGLMLTGPLLPLYYVKVVGATDAQIGIIGTVNSGVLLVAYTAWATLARRRSQRLVLLVACLGSAMYPLLVSQTLTYPLLALWAALAGIAIAGVDLVLFDVLIATCPPDERGTAVGLYHTSVYIATFLAPLLGTLAADYVALSTLLVVAAALRFGGWLLFVVLGVGKTS